MKHYVWLFVFSLTMAALFFAAAYLGAPQQASAVAERLGPEIDMDPDDLRPHLQEIFEGWSLRHAIMATLPWLGMTIYSFIRTLELVSKPGGRGSRRAEANGKPDDSCGSGGPSPSHAVNDSVLKLPLVIFARKTM